CARTMFGAASANADADATSVRRLIFAIDFLLDRPVVRSRAGSVAAQSASGDVKGRPSASATGRQVTLPSCTLRPLRRCASSAIALRQPLSASASAKGRVALLSAKVEVRATAPGMLVTQKWVTP